MFNPHSFCKAFNKHKLFIISGTSLLFLSMFILLFTNTIKQEAHTSQIFIVSKGESIRTIADELKEENLINSSTLFILSNQILGGKILWGTYHLSGRESVFSLAKKFYSGDRNAVLRRVVIHEGDNLYDIARILEDEFLDFDRSRFEEEAIKHHGRLYPDTYFLANEDSEVDSIIEIMTETFSRKTSDLFRTYSGDLSRDELITLASIIELEASRYEDRRRIAGVLLNRLDSGLPLQVDVSFLFINGKDTFDLKRSDLKIDNPLNTYKYSGLPPIPITNPSIDSIKAVIDPVDSDDLFFLADFYGNTHFSETYEEHLLKKSKYIDSLINSGNVNLNSGGDFEENDGVVDYINGKSGEDSSI